MARVNNIPRNFEVFQLYNKRKFIITEVRADPELTKLSQELLDKLDIYFNPVTAQVHVPEIERSIWVIKERFRSMMHQLLYEKITKWMVVAGAEE